MHILVLILEIKLIFYVIILLFIVTHIPFVHKSSFYVTFYLLYVMLVIISIFIHILLLAFVAPRLCFLGNC